MATTKTTINFDDGEGILYVETLDFNAASGTLLVEKIIFTGDASLKDTESNQISARHQRNKLIKIRDKV
tara:strand:- start:89 stop:295 length:207 start_codon:yes stop_codon:yes gene_type:complete